MMHQQIPILISIAFLVAILFPIFMIANLARRNADPTKSKVLFFGIIAFYFIYLAVVSIASFRGLFDPITLPPKIIQVTTFPFLLFLLGFIFNTKLYKSILKKVKLSDLVRLHIFRLIGSFFLILLFLELLPKTFALIAGIGDLVTALSSLFVAKAIDTQKSYAKTLALAWNTFGLADILLTSATAVILTKISMETGNQGVEILATFPFCFIPAFAPATIIFLHLSIYRKIVVKKFH